MPNRYLPLWLLVAPLIVTSSAPAAALAQSTRDGGIFGDIPSFNFPGVFGPVPRSCEYWPSASGTGCSERGGGTTGSSSASSGGGSSNSSSSNSSSSSSRSTSSPSSAIGNDSTVTDPNAPSLPDFPEPDFSDPDDAESDSSSSTSNGDGIDLSLSSGSSSNGSSTNNTSSDSSNGSSDGSNVDTSGSIEGDTTDTSSDETETTEEVVRDYNDLYLPYSDLIYSDPYGDDTSSTRDGSMQSGAYAGSNAEMLDRETAVAVSFLAKEGILAEQHAEGTVYDGMTRSDVARIVENSGQTGEIPEGFDCTSTWLRRAVCEASERGTPNDVAGALESPHGSVSSAEAIALLSDILSLSPDAMIEQGIIAGFSDNRFRGSDSMTRGDFYQWVRRAAAESYPPENFDCSSMPIDRGWFRHALCSGTDDVTDPGAQLEHVEALAVLNNVYDIPVRYHHEEWYEAHQRTATERGLSLAAEEPDYLLQRSDGTKLLASYQANKYGELENLRRAQWWGE